MIAVKKSITYLKTFYRNVGFINAKLKKKRQKFFASHDNMDFYSIPIFIISFNRLSYLEGLVDRLEGMGYKNIYIIDNNSTYPPLLEYYKQTKWKVFKMKRNYGHKVFWTCRMFKKYRNDLYMVTDPDIMPISNCPNNFAEVFYKTLKKYPRIKKAGFSLKINDIPKSSLLYKDIIEWESNFSTFRIPFTNEYNADIDTTLALYIPDYLDISKHFITAVRIGTPYQARHLPWYTKKEEVSEEDIYYNEHRTNGFWDDVHGKLTSEGTSATRVLKK